VDNAASAAAGVADDPWAGRARGDDDMDAFGSGEKLASWAGVRLGNHESAGK
jgi:transposase